MAICSRLSWGIKMRIKAKNVKAELNKILSGFANYRIIATTDDGGCLCEACLKDNLDTIETSYKEDGWHVIDLVCDMSDPVQCDHCSLDASTGEAYIEQEEEN